MLKKLVLILGLILATSTHAQFYKQGNFVTDLEQGIIWLRCSLGQRWDPTKEQCQGEAMRLSHAEIDQAILQANEQLGGKWRLPSLAELEGIVCLECPAPKIDKNVFPNTASEPYWTSHPEIIRLAVMLYVRFPLSLLNVDDLLHERGIVLCQSEVTYFWSEERSQR